MPFEIYRVPLGLTAPHWHSYLAQGGGFAWQPETIWGIIKKYRPPAMGSEIIGMASAYLGIVATDGVHVINPGSEFDTTTRPDSAKIAWINASASSVTVKEAGIHGMVRKRTEGRLHDKFVDYDSIAKNGERKFELGNDFIVTHDQVNKLADYHWKYNRTKRHIYTLDMTGFCSYFEPGEWYSLSFGGAGQDEYVSCTAECYAVHCHIGLEGAVTSVAFREVLENWKHDSNEVARFVASGGHNRGTHRNHLVVAAKGYEGYADCYCPGTSADTAIMQTTFDYLNGAQGGGLLQFTEGTFYISTSLNGISNVVVKAAGPKTIFEIDATGSGLRFIGSAGAHVQNVTLEDFAMKRTDASVNVANLDFQYVDNLNVNRVSLSSFNQYGISLLWGTGEILSCDITGGGASSTMNAVGIWIAASSGKTNIANCRIHDFGVTGAKYIRGILSQANGCVIADNRIYGLTSDASSLSGFGIFADDSSVLNTIIGNVIEDCTGAIALFWGIDVYGNNSIVDGNRVRNNTRGIHVRSPANQTLVTANYCYNNGSDTGIANTNTHNFLDEGTSSMTSSNSWQ